MAIKTLQVTLGASATQVSATNIYVKWVLFQDNAAHSMRIGDANVSSTRGIALSTGGSFFDQPLRIAEATNLAQWWVSGTAADVLDVIYDDVNF